MSYARRVDGNQSEIRDALMQVGCSVQSLARLGEGVPDLLVWSPRCGSILLEVKTDQGKLTPAQQDFHARFPVVIVRSVKDALKAVGLEIPLVKV